MKRINVKKYPNRKFYDTNRGEYITLMEIFTEIRQGWDIIVIDYTTGADITDITLERIVHEHLKISPRNKESLLAQIISL